MPGVEIDIFLDHNEPFERRVLHGLGHIINRLDQIEQKLECIVSAQDDINAAVAALQADETGLDASVQSILAEILELQAANPTVDTSALIAEVANLQTHVDSVATIATATAPPTV